MLATLRATVVPLFLGFLAPRLLWRLPYPALPAVPVPPANRPLPADLSGVWAPNTELLASQQLFKGVVKPGEWDWEGGVVWGGAAAWPACHQVVCARPAAPPSH